MGFALKDIENRVIYYSNNGSTRDSVKDAVSKNIGLDEAYLRYANLSKLKLQGAVLCGADLQKANLEKADLRGADLSRADLTGANLDEVDFRKGTILANVKSDKTLTQVVGVGPEKETVTFCVELNVVWSDKFIGTLREFENKMIKEYKDIYLKEYKAAIAYFEAQVSIHQK